MSLTNCVILDNSLHLIVTHLKNRGIILTLLTSLDCCEIIAQEIMGSGYLVNFMVICTG